MTVITKVRFAEMPTDYAGLVCLHPPRPLRDATDARDVEEILGEMAGHAMTSDQHDYFDLLSDLLLRYQAGREPTRRSRRTPAQRLKYLMGQSGMTPTQLAALLGCSQPLVSLIMGGKRGLSRANVKKLARHFKLDAGYFL